MEAPAQDNDLVIIFTLRAVLDELIGDYLYIQINLHIMIWKLSIGSERMSHATIKREIVRQLDHMSPELQIRVLDFAQALVQPKGVPGKQLLRFAGVLKEEDVHFMTQAIEEGCEQVEISEW